MKKYLDAVIIKLKKRWRRIRQQFHNRDVIRKWQKSGYVYPPPHEYKQQTIKNFAQRFNFDTLIETGTHAGRMPWTLQDEFKSIYTIELNIDNYLNAKEKFYPFEHINVIKGESAEQLDLLLKTINFPALFWLDTHETLEKGLSEYSIKKEIKAILSTKQDHVLLIPDARLFTGRHDYPALIEIRNCISELRPTYRFEVAYDIIRAYEGSQETGVRSK